MLRTVNSWIVYGVPDPKWKTLDINRESGRLRADGLDIYIIIDRHYGAPGNCRVRIEIDGFGRGRITTVNKELRYSLRIRRDCRYLLRRVLYLTQRELQGKENTYRKLTG